MEQFPDTSSQFSHFVFHPKALNPRLYQVLKGSGFQGPGPNLQHLFVQSEQEEIMGDR